MCTFYEEPRDVSISYLSQVYEPVTQTVHVLQHRSAQREVLKYFDIVTVICAADYSNLGRTQQNIQAIFSKDGRLFSQ